MMFCRFILRYMESYSFVHIKSSVWIFCQVVLFLLLYKLLKNYTIIFHFLYWYGLTSEDICRYLHLQVSKMTRPNSAVCKSCASHQKISDICITQANRDWIQAWKHIRHSEKISITHILNNKQHSFADECQLFLLP